MDKIYLVCRECDDTYYAGHPTKLAFFDKKIAEEFINSMTELDDIWQPYYIFEVQLASNLKQGREIFGL